MSDELTQLKEDNRRLTRENEMLKARERHSELIAKRAAFFLLYGQSIPESEGK